MTVLRLHPSREDPPGLDPGAAAEALPRRPEEPPAWTRLQEPELLGDEGAEGAGGRQAFHVGERPQPTAPLRPEPDPCFGPGCGHTSLSVGAKPSGPALNHTCLSAGGKLGPDQRHISFDYLAGLLIPRTLGLGSKERHPEAGFTGAGGGEAGGGCGASGALVVGPVLPQVLRPR